MSVSFLIALSWNLTDFIPEKTNNLQLEDPKVSVQLVDKYRSLATAISESNLTVLHVYRLPKLYHKQKIGAGGGGLMFAFTVALKDPYDPYGIWTVFG